MISILNFDGTKPMSSPRSMRACKALGIDQKRELLNREAREFLDKKEARHNKALAVELAKMELQNHERIRDNLLEQVCD